MSVSEYKSGIFSSLQNVGYQKCEKILKIVNRGSMTETGNKYLTFQPHTRDYVKLESNIRQLESIHVKLTNEKGEPLAFSKDENYGDTLLTVHMIDEQYLKV